MSAVGAAGPLDRADPASGAWPYRGLSADIADTADTYFRGSNRSGLWCTTRLIQCPPIVVVAAAAAVMIMVTTVAVAVTPLLMSMPTALALVMHHHHHHHHHHPNCRDEDTPIYKSRSTIPPPTVTPTLTLNHNQHRREVRGVAARLAGVALARIMRSKRSRTESPPWRRHCLIQQP